MRMVLAEVYVRSVMQFGAPVWAVRLVEGSVMLEGAALRPLCVLHRRMLRLMLHVDKHIPNVLLYVVSGGLSL